MRVAVLSLHVDAGVCNRRIIGYAAQAILDVVACRPSSDQTQ